MKPKELKKPKLHLMTLFIGKIKITGATDYNDLVFPFTQVSKMLDSCRGAAILSGREHEREELVCRLLASGMPGDEISVILNIRIEAIRIIEHNNKAILIPKYEKKLKERRKYREKRKNQ